jgi:hypothetical protein
MTAAVDKDDAEVSKEGEEKVVSESDEASNKKEDGDEEDSKKGDVDATEEEKKETVEEEAKPKKTKIVDWPLRDISEPHPNDVLYGRGGECMRREVLRRRGLCAHERIESDLYPLQLLNTHVPYFKLLLFYRRHESPSRQQAVPQNGGGSKKSLHSQQTARQAVGRAGNYSRMEVAGSTRSLLASGR